MKIKSENQKRESKAIWTVTVAMAVVLFSGCSSMDLQPQRKADSVSLKSQGAEIISMPTELRTQTLKFFIDKDGKKTDVIYSCTEPAPDVTMSSTLKLLAQASTDNTSKNTSKDAAQEASNEAANKNNASLDLQTATTALELAGRTQIVLLAREMLYRICEAGANGWLNADNVLEAQKSVIGQIGDMVKNETATANAKKTSAEAAKTSAEAAKTNADTAAGQFMLQKQMMLQPMQPNR
ncbi:MAG: hypothetical protein ABL911_06010 [Gallionella sp.]|nr:hypothetical protein [Gallionella sp.]